MPASQQEADSIAALWRRSTSPEGSVSPSGELLQVTGTGASRQAFAQYAPGKRVLHVATHGFFLEGSCESAVQRRLDVSKRNESFLPAENPLLLSGLAFAGANRRVPAKADETDRILTAGEIAGINLQGVDWAVLSACDTGVGEVKAGEGVFGLRRAFQVAGAKTVIMSLWPVEDETARQWMEPLYREHFLNGKDTAESVRAASRQILKQRRAKTSKHTSSLLGSLTAVAQSGYPGPDREHDRGYTGQWQERISPDDQKEFKKEYGKWQEANAKNDRDDIDRHARKMEEIMARYHIPPDAATRVPI